MNHFTRAFGMCALLSFALVLYSKIDTVVTCLQPAQLEQNYLTYTCPDGSERTVEYHGKHPVDDDFVLYVKPSIVYPFDPEYIRAGHPRLHSAGLVCAGTCALLSYVMYLAALKQAN